MPPTASGRFFQILRELCQSPNSQGAAGITGCCVQPCEGFGDAVPRFPRLRSGLDASKAALLTRGHGCRRPDSCRFSPARASADTAMQDEKLRHRRRAGAPGSGSADTRAPQADSRGGRFGDITIFTAVGSGLPTSPGGRLPWQPLTSRGPTADWRGAEAAGRWTPRPGLAGAERLGPRRARVSGLVHSRRWCLPPAPPATGPGTGSELGGRAWFPESRRFPPDRGCCCVAPVNRPTSLCPSNSLRKHGSPRTRRRHLQRPPRCRRTSRGGAGGPGELPEVGPLRPRAICFPARSPAAPAATPTRTPRSRLLFTSPGASAQRGLAARNSPSSCLSLQGAGSAGSRRPGPPCSPGLEPPTPLPPPPEGWHAPQQCWGRGQRASCVPVKHSTY